MLLNRELNWRREKNWNTLCNVLIRFENWNISVSQGKDKLAWVWRMEDVECGFGTVVSSIRLPFSFYISPPPRLTAIRWPGLRYIVLAHWLFRPEQRIRFINRLSSVFTAPKEIQFSKEFIIAYIYIIIPFPLWVIRKSDFQFSPKNRFKVVKFLNTRKVFHLFNFVRTPSFFDFCIGWREIKKERLVKFFCRSFSLDTQQQAKTFIPSARSVASRAVSILWSLSHLRAHVWTDRFFNCKCWTSCSDGVINTDYIFPWATSEIISTSPDCHHMRVRLKSY